MLKITPSENLPTKISRKVIGNQWWYMYNPSIEHLGKAINFQNAMGHLNWMWKKKHRRTGNDKVKLPQI